MRTLAQRQLLVHGTDRPRIRHGFAGWQPIFAEHHIATFPLGNGKRPAISAYNKVGLRGSSELASNPKFAAATAFGFMGGRNNSVTVLDVDTADERALADALSRHGDTPLVIRTASGKYHAYFRHNSERRSIRPWPDLAIDILGQNGFVVAAGSELSSGGRYTLVQGKLDDLDRLPVMRPLPPASDGRSLYINEVSGPLADNRLRGMREGNRNNTLFQQIGPLARDLHAAGGTAEKLFEEALRQNSECAQPMDDQEVGKIVGNVWRLTVAGRNYIGRNVCILLQRDIDTLLKSGDHDALLLLNLLKAYQGSTATFMIANGLARTFGWKPERLARARRRLLDRGYVKQTKKAWSGSPAQFQWGLRK